MKSELTRERLQTGLLRIPASLPALLRSPGSFLGLESVPTRNMGPAQCRTLPGFIHAWKLLLGLVEATGYARGFVSPGRKVFLIQALIDAS